MTVAKSAKQIIKAIGCEHLNLYRGSGYWYFVYSNESGNVYEDKSIYTMYLGDLSLEQWSEEGKELVATVEGK